MATEKRLIDANALAKNGWHLVKAGRSNQFLASMSLADVPTVDAVEVVRCVKCKSWDPVTGYCQFWHGFRPAGHYCGEGEKK